MYNNEYIVANMNYGVFKYSNPQEQKPLTQLKSSTAVLGSGFKVIAIL